MNELSRTEKWLEKAYELAYFIHGDAEVAKQIAFNAMNKLEVASNAQFKRFYYTPEARNSRNKVSMNDLQLLQRLVYVESESFEKEKEFTETATERDLLIYFIKHLIRITLKRNSFYVTLGLSRILHSYGTSEAMEIYNVVVQDPERVHDDYYYRSRKGILMKELKNRFGEKLEIAHVNRGEQRFQSAASSHFETELVKNCLQSFTPWNTVCDLPDKFNPQLETIKSLCFNGKNADDEHRIELNRMHVLLNPETFEKVVDALSFPRPEEKLEIPKFNMKKKKDTPETPDDWKNPPSLKEDELKELASRLETEAARRKSASCGYFRVLVDGEQAGFFDSIETSAHHFHLDTEFAELIEVYSVDNGRDTLLATYLLGGDDRLEPATMLLDRGQKISFSFDGSGCEVSYRETRLNRKLACWWKRGVGGIEIGRVRQSALAMCGMLLAFGAGLFMYFASPPEHFTAALDQTQFRQELMLPAASDQPAESRRDGAAEQTVEKTVKIVEPRRESSSRQDRPGKNKTLDPVGRRDVGSGGGADQGDVKKFPVIERREDIVEGESRTTRGIDENGKALKDIKYIFIEVTGDERFGRQLGEHLMDEFNRQKRFLAVNNRDKADGLLKVSVRREHDNAGDEQTFVTATVRLVNSDGFVVFPSRKRISAWRYVGRATSIPSQVVRDLAGRK